MTLDQLDILRTINYPGLMAVNFLVFVFSLLYHRTYRREFAAVVCGFYFLCGGFVFGLLAIGIGVNPVVPLATLNPYIQVGRSLQLLVGIWLVILLSRRVLNGAGYPWEAKV